MLGNWPVYYTTLYGHPTHPLIMLSIGLSIQQHYWSTHFSPDTARRNLEIDRTVYVDIFFFTFIELLALINWNNWKYNIVTSTFWCCHSSWWHPPASWAWSPPGPSGRRYCPMSMKDKVLLCHWRNSPQSRLRHVELGPDALEGDFGLPLFNCIPFCPQGGRVAKVCSCHV